MFGVLFVNATNGTEMSGLDSLLSDSFLHLQITLKKRTLFINWKPITGIGFGSCPIFLDGSHELDIELLSEDFTDALQILDGGVERIRVLESLVGLVLDTNGLRYLLLR